MPISSGLAAGTPFLSTLANNAETVPLVVKVYE